MKLMNAIVKSLVKNFANLGGAAVGFPIAGDIVVDAWDNWHKDGDIQKMRVEIEAYARQSVQDALAEAQKAVAVEAPNLSKEAQKQIVDYVSLVPASIRRSLRRPADHSGLSVPPGLALRKASDLVPFLPATLPRFKAGDQPLPHTDLELIELVGQGGFGEVWKARHLDRPNFPLVALKFCLDASAAKSLANERTLLDHLAMAGKINGIVQLHNTHLRATPPCLEYEYVEGGDLTSLIAELHENGTPDTDLVARIVLQLTQIIAQAHQQNPAIVHRDLKPANILVRRVDKNLSFKIADFGIGALAANKALHDHKTGKTKMAQRRMDTILGAYTPFYASPEQVSGEVPDPRDDVHALGVIWFQLQTGNRRLMTMPPHWREDLHESGMSQEFVNVLAACINRLKDRPCDAVDLARRLEKLLAPPQPQPLPEPVPTATFAAPPPEPKQSSKRQSRKTLTTMIAIGVPLLAGIMVLLFNWDRLTTKKKNAPLPMASTVNFPAGVPTSYTEKQIDMEMRLIPAGKFLMGSPDAFQHEIEITKPYYLSAHPVTRGQFRRFVNDAKYNAMNGWLNPGITQEDDHPVVCVSWHDAKAYCNWLNNRATGKTYDLPTEAQWEYACRGKLSAAGGVEITTDPYWFGKTISPQQANYFDSKKSGTTPVRTYQPNGFGLYDMHGNVWQWCADWYGEDYYNSSPKQDPFGPSGGSNRVIRGGCWGGRAAVCTAAYRVGYEPGGAFGGLGFRLLAVSSGK